jgi:hypothetical protein
MSEVNNSMEQINPDLVVTLAHSAEVDQIDAVPRFYDRFNFRARSLTAATIVATAAVFGAAESVSAQPFETIQEKILRQRYDTYVDQLSDPLYVKPFEEYFDSKKVDDTCSDAHEVLGQATYGLRKGELTMELGRKSTIFSDEVALMSDPTPGANTPSDRVWAKLSIPCSNLVVHEASVQLWELKAKTVRGKYIKEWQRVPGTKNVKLPDWQPNAVRSEVTDDKTINPVLQNISGLKLSVPAVKRKKPAALKNVYPAIVLHSTSKITTYESKMATILPSIPKLGKITVNAGAKRYGKGGAITSTGFDGYPGYK